MRRGRSRLAAALALVVVLVPALAGVARAEEPPAPAPVPVPAPAPEPRRITTEELERRLTSDPARALAILALRLGLVAAGIAVLVVTANRRRAERRGLVPPAPRVEPTQTFRPLQALGLVFVVLLAGTAVGRAAVTSRPELADSLAFKLALSAGIQLPIAVVLVLRRLRMPPGPTVRGLRAVGAGLAGLAVASAIMVVLAITQALVLRALGEQAPVQPLVNDFLYPAEPWMPAAIFAFGVLVAPFLEEALNRGLLYPAFRALGGGGARGAWIGAVVSSLVFAAMHADPFAFLPLFVLAMVLARLFERTNSLTAVVTLHAGNNLLTFVTLWMVPP